MPSMKDKNSGAIIHQSSTAAFMHMVMPPPSIMVVHPSGAPIGTADTIKDHPEAVEASAHDPGDTGPSSHEEAGDLDGDGDQDMLADNDHGNNDDVVDDFDDAGGGFDGGDIGGGDFGGGDDF